MFPIRDHNPSGKTPYVTWALIAANIVIFLATWPGADDRAIYATFINYGMVPAQLMAGEGWTGIITSMFLHAGWMHLAGNMLFLWIFGDNVEETFGHLKFLGFYLIAGLAAAGLQMAFDPFSTIPMVGASGAIAGVMGSYLLLFPKARVDVLIILIVFFRIFPVPAWIVLGVWLALQMLGGWSVSAGEGGVAYWAHTGGFLAGLALTFPLWVRLGGVTFWSRTHGTPPHPEAKYKYVSSSLPKIKR